MAVREKIERFLAGVEFAVAGASRERSKFGNKVLRCYLQNNREVYAVNPNADFVEGVRCYPNLESLPVQVHGVSIVTPPDVTAKIVDEAIELEIPNLWMQPGAEDEDAIQRAKEAGVNVIAGGPCFLAEMGFEE